MLIITLHVFKVQCILVWSVLCFALMWQEMSDEPSWLTTVVAKIWKQLGYVFNSFVVLCMVKIVQFFIFENRIQPCKSLANKENFYIVVSRKIKTELIMWYHDHHCLLNWPWNWRVNVHPVSTNYQKNPHKSACKLASGLAKESLEMPWFICFLKRFKSYVNILTS